MTKVRHHALRWQGGMLRKSRGSCAAAAAILLLTAIRASPHHSFAAEYDKNKLITISGMVTKFEWTNPHALLYVDGRDAEG